MSEVITPVEKLTDSEGEALYIIKPENTIADIYRWLVEEDWINEVITLHELETENND